MKVFYITMAIISIMLTLMFFMLTGFNSSADDLIVTLEDMMSYVKKGDWEKSSELFNIFEEKWQNTKNFWAAIIDHQELDVVNSNLIKIKYYNLEKKTMESLMEIEHMIRFIEHLKEKENLKMANIF